jgi:succinate-semialdehyde dehydrogenase/glutarate-semialdehyde dehydrogenase
MLTDSEKSLLARVPTGLFIDGKWRASSNGTTIDVEDPSTGETLTSVADATVADGVAALDAAVAAQADWAVTPPRDRGEILRKAFLEISARTAEFALLMTLEMGKPLAESRAEVTYAAEFFRWFSEEAVRISGRWSVSPNGATRLMTMKQPVGPTLMITPWNFRWRWGPARSDRRWQPAAPWWSSRPDRPPLSMLALVEVLSDCGVPAGVVNVITTSRTGEVIEPIIRDPRLRKLTFTGSTPVGRKLVEQSAEQLLRVSMELGGNAPFLVFEDADMDAAVAGAMVAKMRNMGEACTAANRFLVQESVADEFASRFAAKMAGMTLGRGTQDDVTTGPLIDATAQAGVASLVEDAKSKGAKVVCGGATVGDRGYFYAPTVLTGVPADARMMHEEIFGPVAPIATFATESEAISRANDTEYGLVAYVFTRDLSRTLRVSEALEFGMVGINQGIVSNPAAPFGGVKHSGFGREGGFEGIEEYLEIKYVGIAP